MAAGPKKRANLQEEPRQGIKEPIQRDVSDTDLGEISLDAGQTLDFKDTARNPW